MMERKLFDGWGLFITKDLSYVGFFTDDRVCLIEKAGSGFRDKILEIMKKNSYEFEF